ncbi:hypothetical protein [Streptomyces sp. BE303]|uniref:hypothetical protein n=1 Tax=Streptomyces sp. BE303 TaxID=3002528 RepID=UPI002E794B96|nr:hypothetical protein [Streptomyces sp. BE303]MED7947566.1 hypothetical protein [Streptomyces sp. BE303]
MTFLNRAVSDHCPNDHALDHQAVALLLNTEQRYQRALAAAVQRIVERGRGREATPSAAVAGGHGSAPVPR